MSACAPSIKTLFEKGFSRSKDIIETPRGRKMSQKKPNPSSSDRTGSSTYETRDIVAIMIVPDDESDQKGKVNCHSFAVVEEQMPDLEKQMDGINIYHDDVSNSENLKEFTGWVSNSEQATVVEEDENQSQHSQENSSNRQTISTVPQAFIFPHTSSMTGSQSNRWSRHSVHTVDTVSSVNEIPLTPLQPASYQRQLSFST